MNTNTTTSIEAGTKVLASSGEIFEVDETLAARLEPGDRLVANVQAGLLHLPAADLATTAQAVANCVAAFDDMAGVTDEQIVAFFNELAATLEDDDVWAEITAKNALDVEAAKAKGRSTTRLAVSDAMRQNMIDGLRGWATTPSRRDATIEEIDHEGFQIELVGAPLGVVAFVFEGRPNVLVDACGVLRGGNTAIFRIGSDALGTAQALMARAVHPALVATGLPKHALTLIESASHASGWALFLDDRVALAVARGSGPAVDLLGALAQSVGTPASLHGTGGAWMIASAAAQPDALAAAVTRSLDRKVCNTLNTCCIQRDAAETLVPAFLDALEQAAQARGTACRLHVVGDADGWVPDAWFTTKTTITRADGPCEEFKADTLSEDRLSEEWEWEVSPEVTLTLVDAIDDGVRLFNQYSPRLVASLISDDEDEHRRFWASVHSPFIGDGHTRWVDGQFALAKPELGLSNWANGRLFGRGGILTGDSVFTIRTRFKTR